MELNDLDDLSVEEFAAKKRTEKQAYLDNQPQFSRNDMISFGIFAQGEHWKLGKSVKKILLDWEKKPKYITKCKLRL